MKLYSTFNAPLCEIWQGDCRSIIEANQVEWKGAFDFIFADPPFNIGHGYDIYKDAMSDDGFYAFMVEWMGACCHCLRDGGVMVIHIPDDLVWIPLITLRPDVASMTRIDWVIWSYRFAVCQSLDTANGFLSSKAHGLVFRKGSDPINDRHTFNARDVAVPSDRATKYNDPRINETANGGSRVPLDVWTEFPRVQGNNEERQGLHNHPNQLPEKYLERYIRAYTNPGDFVLDPFGGTGTTAVVARALERNVVTCELSQTYCDDIAERVQEGSKRI